MSWPKLAPFRVARARNTTVSPLLKTFHALFEQGNAQGITFVASSGDNGALECESAAFVNNPTNGTNFVLGVSSPANDPNVTGSVEPTLRCQAYWHSQWS